MLDGSARHRQSQRLSAESVGLDPVLHNQMRRSRDRLVCSYSDWGILCAAARFTRPRRRLYLRAGTLTGLIASLLVAFPTGDQQAKMVGRHQPVTLAAMEGKFVGGPMAGVAVIGQPNVAARRLDNPIEVPGALSFLAYGTFEATCTAWTNIPRTYWPDNIELLYYSFHLMITLGTIFIVLMAYANFAAIGAAGWNPTAGCCGY